MKSLTFDMYQTALIAMIFFVIGTYLCKKIKFLQKFCIPAPVVGGLLFSILHLILYSLNLIEFSFTEDIKNIFMTLFFTCVGFTASFKLIKKGGSKVIKLLIISIIAIVIENVVSIYVGNLFNLDHRISLCAGSISMAGGHGTAAAWGETFKGMGLNSATSFATACATFGLIGGSLIGGPIAFSLIKKYRLKEKVDDYKKENNEEKIVTNKNRYIKAVSLIIIACGFGTIITKLLNGIKLFGVTLTFPGYIGAMIAGSIIRNIFDLFKIKVPEKEINVWSENSLNIFLSIALITLKLWQLYSLALPMIVILLSEVLIAFIIIRYIVFYFMGKDYDASVICSGMGGVLLGATPNGIANMESVSDKYGNSKEAFFIVPLIGALFVDFFNGIIISIFVNLF